MLKILLVISFLISMNIFAQTPTKPDPTSSINAEEQIHGLPGGNKGAAYSVKTKKKGVTAPSNIAPVENHTPANCADSLGSTSGASFTSCEAAKKTR